MNSRAFSLGWSHLRCAPRPPSLLPLAFCSFIFFALAFLGERDAPGSKELQRLVAGLQPRSMQLSPHLRGLIQHQHHPVAPLGAAFLLHRACTHQAGSGTAPAAASPGSSGGKTGQPCQPLRPLRRGSPLLRHRGMGPSDPPPPPSPGLQAGFAQVPAGGTSTICSYFWLSFPNSYKFGAALGCRAQPRI